MTRPEAVDVLVVGAGPAGSSAARAAALAGARVLLVERRRQVGLPVQCAEFVPWQLGHEVSIPARCVAQAIQTMRTVLPDGTEVDKPSAGYVLDRALWDKHLAVLARRAGAEIRTGWKAVEYDGDRGVRLRRGGREARIDAQVIVGADGPHSIIGAAVGQAQSELVHAVEVEVALAVPRQATEVYFHPLYRGGYGWLFPKGDTANVGVAVGGRLGGRLGPALAHLLDRLGLSRADVVGILGGAAPARPVAALCSGRVLLAGDAAGLAHPITGGGIAPAVLSGRLAGKAAARCVRGEGPAALAAYAEEWEAARGAAQRQALSNRRYLDARWTDDVAALSALVRETWIAFPAYGRPKPD